MIFLIEFEYELFSQGWEWKKQKMLIRNAKDFSDACKQIEKSEEFKNPHNFRDLTI